MKQLVCLCISLVFVVACSSSDSTSSSGSGSLSTTATNLETVSEGFKPSSLDSSSSASSKMVVFNQGEQGDDPCAGVDDLFACMPILLMLYYDMAQEMLSSMQEILAEISSEMGDLADTTTPTSIDISQSGETMTVSYTKSGAELTVLISDEDGTPMMYVTADADGATLKVAAAMMTEGESEGEDLEITFQYTDEDNWSINLFLFGMECQDEDFRAPERIKIIVNKSDGLWTGLAMMYHPRWLYGDSADCNSAVADDKTMNIYTQFVGNDVAAKAQVFFAGRAVTDFTEGDEDNYGLPAVCNELGCTGNEENPFCSVAGTGTPTATWADDCSATSVDVGNADYLAFSNWIDPSEFFQETSTLPTSLE